MTQEEQIFQCVEELARVLVCHKEMTVETRLAAVAWMAAEGIRSLNHPSARKLFWNLLDASIEEQNIIMAKRNN